MKNSSLLIVFVLLIFVIGKADTCGGTVSVDPPRPNCDRNSEGSIKFTNNTNEKRSFYLNNVLIVSVNEHSTSAEITKKVGNYSVKVENAYNSQDVSCLNTIAISQCATTTYSCPF